MGVLKIVSWNVHGLKRIKGLIANNVDSYDIICLQETWLRQHDEELLCNIFPSHNNACKSSMNNDVIYKGRPFGGLSILWKRELDDFVTHIELDYSNISAISITANGRKLYVVNVYMPYACSENEENIRDAVANLLSVWEINDCDDIILTNHPINPQHSHLRAQTEQLCFFVAPETKLSTCLFHSLFCIR